MYIENVYIYFVLFLFINDFYWESAFVQNAI